MPNFHDLYNELQQAGSHFDILRKKYISKLYNIRKRNIICYYSGWLDKPNSQNTSVNDIDKNGFMTVMHKMDFDKGLDLILHTPGGGAAATESIVDYLHTKFGNDIVCFVPQMAMSAGTMIACSCKEIYMGAHSSLGPIDPQIGGVAAHGIIEEFKTAQDDATKNPNSIPLWQPIIAKYPPTILGECHKAIKWSTDIVKEWLRKNMLANNDNRESIIKELGDHSINLAHNRHLSARKCKEIGLIIKDLEEDDDLQDAVLSIHHVFMHTLRSTNAVKIIQNNSEISFVINQEEYPISSITRQKY